jgi:predicted DNA-binding transcriptional regulator AlpA
MTELPLVVSYEDLAGLFQVTTKTIRGYIKKGRLPSPTRLGYKTYRWRREDLQPALARLFEAAA